LKKIAVVSATEAKGDPWRFLLLHVSATRGEVTVYTVKNVEGCLAVDGSKIGLGFN
jgi:hypothetical protein